MFLYNSNKKVADGLVLKAEKYYIKDGAGSSDLPCLKTENLNLPTLKLHNQKKFNH
jgi:hypothetical protein